MVEYPDNCPLIRIRNNNPCITLLHGVLTAAHVVFVVHAWIGLWSEMPRLQPERAAGEAQRPKHIFTISEGASVTCSNMGYVLKPFNYISILWSLLGNTLNLIEGSWRALVWLPYKESCNYGLGQIHCVWALGPAVGSWKMQHHSWCAYCYLSTLRSRDTKAPTPGVYFTQHAAYPQRVQVPILLDR